MEEPSPEGAATAVKAPARLSAGEVGAVAAMLLMFVAAQLVAVLLIRPFEEAGVRGFEDPEDPKNGLWLLLLVFAFTGLILFIARKRREKLIQYLILASVGLTLVYVLFPLFNQVPGRFFSGFELPLGPIHLPVWPGLYLAIILASLLTWALYRYPEWYVVDTVGVLVAAGGIAIFGSSFTPLTYLVVLVGFAVYDYISVYKTKHMLSLADSVLKLHLPIMLVAPKTLHYSFLEEEGGLRKGADEPKPPSQRREAMFLGLGDVVIPTVFAITAIPLSTGAAAGAIAGTLAGFLLLMTFVLRGKPQAGLPSLNGGALLGFLVGLYWETGSLVFW